MALKLVGEISLDGSGWTRGLKKAGDEASHFAHDQMGEIKNAIAQAFTVGAIIELTKKTIEYARHVDDLATRLGVSTDYLQEMQYVTKQNGASIDDLTSAMERLNAARMKALGGNAVAQNAFGKLGVTMGDLSTQSGDRLMDTIAGQFHKLGSSPELAAAFREVGGRGAGVLIPSFVEGLEKGRAEARENGAIMSDETIFVLKHLADETAAAWQTILATTGNSLMQLVRFFEYAFNSIEQLQAGLANQLANLVTGKHGNGEQWMDEQAIEHKKALAKAKIDLDEQYGDITPEQAAKKRAEIDKIKSEKPGTFSEGAEEVFQKLLEKWQADFEKIQEHKARQGSAFKPITETPPSVKMRSADSLVSVGNFLGQNSNASMIEDIAKKHLNEATKQTALLQSISDSVESGSLGVP